MKKLIAILIASVLVSPYFSEDAFARRAKKNKTELQKDSLPKADKSGLMAYDKVITSKAKTMNGFFGLHFIDNKYYFEIPDSLLGRDILVVNRIAKSPVNYRKSKTGYPGDFLSDKVVRFEKAKDNRLFLHEISYEEHSSDTLGLYKAVLNSNIQPIIKALKLKSIRKMDQGANYLVDITDYIKDDNSIYCIDERVKGNLGLGAQQNDISYIDTVKAFPLNIEVRTVRTFNRKKSVPKSDLERLLAMLAPDPLTPLTYELNSSMRLLPKEPMRTRLYDPRVGLFAVSYTDFDSNPQGYEVKRRVTRWRLEPKEEDIERYLKGELVEPKKPIVIYIDPATPKKWVPYLKQGVNAWQEAFEAAGFKNAIMAKDAPVDDPTWSIEDARHSAIVYKASDIPNASGPHVHDPRSGEILETHVNWYHNILSVLYNWYFVQVAPLDKAAQKPVFDDELMGQLITYVSCHELGHTLGLRHNFGASSTIPVEKLRDKAWVEANGPSPSIMDYSRFNYVAQPEDNISRKGLFPRVGIYDKWAIEWAYRWFPEFKSEEEEEAFMQDWVIRKLREDKRYTFGHEFAHNDPRNQNEDLGDDAMKASHYGILNLKRIMPNIVKWTVEPHKSYSKSANVYTNIVEQFAYYMGHVSKHVGGIYSNPVTSEQTEVKAMAFVPKSVQKEAVAFLCKELFETPQWLINEDLLEKTGLNMLSAIFSVQSKTVKQLVSATVLDKLSTNEAFHGSKAYTSSEFLNDMEKGIFAQFNAGKKLDLNRRNLQKVYVKSLIKMLDKERMSGSPMTESPTIARAQLISLQRRLKAMNQASAGIQKAHFINLLELIEKAFDTKA